MIRKSTCVLVCIFLHLASARVAACAGHFSIDPEGLGFFGAAAVRMAGLAPPERVFKLEHPAVVKAVIGEEDEIVVDYTRPFFSKNVRLEVRGTKNVQLLQREIDLDERSGTVSIPYQLLDSGYDSITVIVSGEHKGETVREVGHIYVRAVSKTIVRSTAD